MVARSRLPHRNHKRRVPYCLGEKRVVTLALLTFTALSGSRSCGVTSSKMLFRLSKVRSPGRSNELGANFVAVPPGHLALALPDDTVGGKE